MPSNTLKMVFTAFLSGAQHQKYNVEKKPASSFASLIKPLYELPPCFWGRQRVGSSSFFVAMAKSK